MGMRKSVRNVRRISRTTSRNNKYDGCSPETSSDAAEEQTPKATSQKRQGSPLLAVQYKRAKVEGTGEVHSANSSPRTPSAAPDDHHTLTREERLRADPYADVRGAQLVVCRLCGTEVRLSNRATYGLSHWKRHSERCRSEHGVENTQEVCLKAALDASRRDADEKPRCMTPSPPTVRISPGPSPLKLKITIRRRARKRSATPAADSGEESTSTAAVSDMLREHDAHTQDVGPSSPNNADPWDDDKGIQLKQSISNQSSISGITILTSPDPHGDLPTVTISSPSCSVSDDTFGQPELPVAKWTDGPHTTSPQEIVFAETFTDTDAAADPRIAASDAEIDHTVGLVMHTGVVTSIEAPILEANGKSEPDGSKDPIVVQASGPAPTTSSVSEAETSLSLPDIPSLWISTSPEEDNLSNLELEYPDWDPQTSSSVFEHELRASGICLENIFNHRSLLIAV